MLFIGWASFVFSVSAAAQTKQPAESYPLLHPAIAPAAELGWEHGMFGFTFGTAGWPDGIAPLGRDPNRVQLELDGLSMNDMFTGRPRFDLLPVAWLFSLSSSSSLGYVAQFDSLLSKQPMTFVRYESSGSSAQAVGVLHVQNRIISQSSSPKRLQTAFGYSGEGGRGEYDGSSLKRARVVSARIGIRSETWSIELSEFAQRRSVGAQAGVIPFNGADYSSIYQRLGATVEDETARRRSLRNDLVLRLSTTISGLEARFSGIWTRETLDFSNESIQEKGVMDRIGGVAEFQKQLAKSKASIRLSLNQEALNRGSVFSEGRSTSRAFYSAKGGIEGTFRVLSYFGSLGFEGSTGTSWSTIDAGAVVKEGPFSINLALHRAGRALTWHELNGFGQTISRSPFDVQPIEQFVSATLGWKSGLFSIDWTGMLSLDRELLVTQKTTDATKAAVEWMPGSSSSSVSSFVFGFRTNAESGIWAEVNPVVRSTRTDDASSLAAAWRASLPSAWATATLGWKALLFNDDLDLKVYARARFWDEMGGLRLHTPTGLLVLPLDTSERVESNWLVDFVAEGGIRGATLFLSYENAFSGTTALFGNLIIPDYPLPQQRTRFGVYWPILN